MTINSETDLSRGYLRRRARHAAGLAVGVAGWLKAALVSPDPPPSGRWLGRAWLVALFIAGAAAWYFFLDGGKIDFARHDWVETGHRYAFLQDAARKGVLPLHMSGEWALRNVTDRFASVPDTNLSPLIYLMAFVGIGRFIVVQTLWLYGAGFAGLLLLRRRFGLSLPAFSALFLLLFFNGNIAAHIAVGNVHWATYLLVPLFLWLIFDVLDGPRHPWLWTLYLSIYMLTVLLHGAFHLFVATLFFLGVLALSHRERLGLLLRGMIFSVLIGGIRILPPLLHLSEFDTGFLSGFATLGELLRGMIHLVPPRPELALRGTNPLSPLGWWEFDHFVGVAGVVFLAAFFAYGWQGSRTLTLAHSRLILPIAVLTTFSVGRAYQVFHNLQVPLLATQRVSSRVFYIPFSFLILLSVLGFQRFLDRRRLLPIVKVALAVGLVLIAMDLGTHFALWQVKHIPGLFVTPGDIDMTLDVVANHRDPVYLQFLLTGSSTSVASLLLLGYFSWREVRHGKQQSPAPG